MKIYRQIACSVKINGDADGESPGTMEWVEEWYANWQTRWNSHEGVNSRASGGRRSYDDTASYCTRRIQS